MVSLSDIRSNNDSVKHAGSGATAVFVGATQGIGLGTLKAFAKNTDEPTVYVVGRTASSVAKVITEVKQLNAGGTFIGIAAGDLTRLRNVDKASGEITSQASRIDMLFLSPGFLSFGGRDESAEGLDKITSIRYYARMRFVINLLPQLRASPSPRVLSVLAGGMEGQLWADDLPLKEHYGIKNAGDAAASMTSLFMEHAAQQQPENAKLVFAHAFPGLVRDTNVFNNTEHFHPATRFLLGWVVVPLLLRPFASTSAEVGERMLFVLTSGRFRRLGPGAAAAVAQGTLLSKGSNGQLGSGVYLVQSDSSTVEGGKALQQLRKEGMAQKVWDHTMQEFERICG